MLTLYQTTKVWKSTKLKAFADGKLKVAQTTISPFDKLEHAVGKGENAGNQHFFIFPLYFSRPSSKGLLKVGIVW